MGESMTLEGATDAAAFEAYVEHFPLPHPFVKGKWWCSMGWGTQDTEGKGTHPSQRGRPRVCHRAKGVLDQDLIDGKVYLFPGNEITFTVVAPRKPPALAEGKNRSRTPDKP
jgi:hypothetical protein